MTRKDYHRNGGSAPTLVDALTRMDFNAVSNLFAENEAGSPAVLWNPSEFDILHPTIKSFADYMHASGMRKLGFSDDSFSSLEGLSFEPWVMMLEPLPDLADFRYLKYGSGIASVFGRDMTGCQTSEIGGHISDFFVALYVAVILRKESVLSVHVPPLGVFATVWRRLIIPLLDDENQVRMIAAVNIPDNELRAGLEALPDPALVANEDGLLMFANASARRLFGDPGLPRVKLSEYCGIDIDLPESAETLARAESSTVCRVLGSRNQLLMHFELRMSATFFRGTPYFIVQLKPQ